MEAFSLLIVLCTFSAMAWPALSDGTTFSVDHYGAKGDGKSDDTQAFTKAWKDACAASGSPILTIPNKKYLVGPLTLFGPCKNSGIFTIKMDGIVKASTNLNLYKGQEWVLFGHVSNLQIRGKGTFDGQGTTAWPFNECVHKRDCKVLPVSLKFINTKHTVVDGITSLNPKFFHVALLDNEDFTIQNVKITAPEDSPNTDGIHLERCNGVKILNSDIGTGDDCVSVGQGNSNVYVNGVNCGPGHGISVGSLGRYSYEKDVTGLVVSHCTLTGTMNGVRIKSWKASPVVTSARNMTFDHITFKDVGNPIIIDQNYCPYTSCGGFSSPSRVKISDVTFSNIKGTSTTPVAVTLNCSSGYPCKNVKVQEINISYKGGAVKSACANVKATYSGAQHPSPCK